MTKILDDDAQEWLDYKCHYLKNCLEAMMESIRQMRNLIGYPDREVDTCRH